MITVMVIEGVLAHGEDLKTAQPTKWARQLYDGLRSQNNMVGLTRADDDIAQWWLNREHMNKWARVLSYPKTTILPWDHWRIDFVRDCLAEGWEIFAYVDTRLHVVDEVRSLGVCGLHVSYPPMPVGWKEVAPPRAWAEVVNVEDTSSGRRV